MPCTIGQTPTTAGYVATMVTPTPTPTAGVGARGTSWWAALVAAAVAAGLVAL